MPLPHRCLRPAATSSGPPARLPTRLQVLGTYLDCDRDSLIYLSEPIGPACHTNAPTCYFTQLEVVHGGGTDAGELRQAGAHDSRRHAPMTTLHSLERIIAQRRAEAEAGTAPGALRCAEGCGLGWGVGVRSSHQSHSAPSQPLLSSPPPPADGKPSWTARLLADPELLCRKVREEAGELCQTLEEGEGRERAASEAADLLYHAMVLLNAQVGGWAGGAAVSGAWGVGEGACRWRRWGRAAAALTCAISLSLSHLPASSALALRRGVGRRA